MSAKKIEYIMYDSSTDLPVCIGNIDECAKCAGTSPSTLMSGMHRYLTGERGAPRYQLYDIDKVVAGYYLEEGDCDGELC